MSDPLASWWIHEITVERSRGRRAGGETYDTPKVEVGFWDVQTVKTTEGATMSKRVDPGGVLFPLTVDPVPVGSRLTRNGVTTTVTAVAEPDTAHGPNYHDLEVSG